MARDGLSEQECAEILGELRSQNRATSDELLVWLAECFALEAPVDFDSNDLATLLSRTRRRITRRRTFSKGVSSTEALEALLREGSAQLGVMNRFSGGLLILRATAKWINEHWPESIGAVMGRFREVVGPNADAVYGVLVDEQIPVGFELFILLAVSDTPESDGGRC